MKSKIRVPRLSLDFENMDAVVQAMTEHVALRVSERANRGEGAEGKLPTPKDGGEPLNRTGTLRASIGAKIRPGVFGPARKGKSNNPTGVVRAFGGRPSNERERIASKKAAAKQRTAQLRLRAKKAIEGAKRSRLGLSLYLSKQDRLDFGKLVRLKSNKLSIGRIRRRTVVDNASLAAILSVPPKDKRGIAGNRGVYRIFLAKDSDVREAGDIAKKTMQVRLVETGTVEVKR